MSKNVITVEGVYKQFYKGSYYNTGFQETIVNGIKNLLGNHKNSTGLPPAADDNNFWALQNVSFTIEEGENVGIIGSNGAGKSTLLKILSRITHPTKGKVTIYGRISSLLEVGTGFHPELTGRENIYLNGALLGMTRKEIKRRFDEIVAFSEVENFIDTPIKHYSSGMQVRLAFSVSLLLDAEIMIIDEVLSVGDISFQEKSLNAIKSYLNKGRTILIVSHNMETISQICNRVMVLKKGQILSIGDPGEEIFKYKVVELGQPQNKFFAQWDNLQTAPGDDRVRLLNIGVKASGKDYHDPIFIEDYITITITYQLIENISCIDVFLSILGEKNQICTGVVSDNSGFQEKGIYSVSCTLKPFFLNRGLFSLTLYFYENKKLPFFCKIEPALFFEVLYSEANPDFRTLFKRGMMPILPHSFDTNTD
ncbi:ABC transporter ATP-binding protein [Sphingobacteriales bacterium UPWRP_1]|nr:hypothetical protein BVG80_16065 [Sphingobacteriales bacterium TSM_CSM]PSJ74989.1 ABC transporter ATP-binding protein [Sphingobacteriales bacterium UPWRP_1]